MGLNKGLAHIAQLIAFLYWAILAANTAAIGDGIAVAAT